MFSYPAGVISMLEDTGKSSVTAFIYTMKYKNYYIILLLSGLFISCTNGDISKNTTGKEYTAYVDPLIGSGGHGHVFVGASLPHGMVQLGPNNLSKGWDWCSGYHDSDSTIIGFAHTHLSGTGIADLGDILFMPVVESENSFETKGENLVSGYVSLFRKENQVVRPGYYAVKLDKHHIGVELTASERVGFHRYTYPPGVQSSLIIDLNESVQSLIARKGVLDSSFRIINDTTVTGYRMSDEWATDHKVWFTTVFSRPITSHEINKEAVGIRAKLNFGTCKEPLLAKTGISYVSEEGSALNLRSEISHWDFDSTVSEATDKWNAELAKIEIDADPETRKIFYTAMYHTLIAPILFSDCDGRYRGANGNIYVADSFQPYTVFSLWDTYRAVHPLYTLIDSRNADYVNSLLAIYDQQGRMPVWHLVGNETDCMVGVHSIPVVVDACLKNISGINMERAYHAVSSIRNMNNNGLAYVRNGQYIPADKVNWSVARALEYAIDDYAVAQLANNLNKAQDYELFAERAKAHKYYFDKSTGFMRGKLSDGNWRSPFDPTHSLHLEDDYVEGNGWQYTWLVPHNVEGLIDLFGGRELFIHKLDSLFTIDSGLNEGASADITGMIGQYAHGNEPSHHTVYLYAYAGQQWKTAELVREIFGRFYNTTPEGLIGNEDCGQMSAWYILSALGFYPVNPVDGTFVFGSPVIDHAILHLYNGKTFEINIIDNNKHNKYIQSVRLNGKPYSEFKLNYNDIMNGGELEITMGSVPNHTFSNS